MLLKEVLGKGNAIVSNPSYVYKNNVQVWRVNQKKQTGKSQGMKSIKIR